MSRAPAPEAEPPGPLRPAVQPTSSKLPEPGGDAGGLPEASEEPAQAAPSAARVRPLSGFAVPADVVRLRSSHIGEAVTVVMLPPGYRRSPEKSYPLVIAFSGSGESAKAPGDGARAWIQYYKADEAVAALRRGKLTAEDFRGLATKGQIEAANARLREQPAKGLIVACPWSPLIRGDSPVDDPGYEAYLMDELLPALLATYRVEPGRVGIDGVSMGGTRSLYYGLKHPDRFRSIGAIQGSFGRYLDLYKRLVEEHADLLSRRPIQLVTSDGDPLRPGVVALDAMLRAHHLQSSLVLLRGPHDYIFNQGPGSIALLMFHERELWPEGEQAGGEATPPTPSRDSGAP